jgi:aminomethyltransferase
VTLRLPLEIQAEAAGARFEERDGWIQAAAYAELDDELAALRAGTAVADRSARALVRVTGPDAERLLQGLVTNDVDALAPGAALEAFVLTPKGRPHALLRLLRLAEDAFVLESEPAAHDAIAVTLRRYRLASKAEIEDARGELAVLGLPAALALPHGVIELPGGPGREAAGDPNAMAELWVAAMVADAQPVGADAWEAFRIEAGVPRLGADIDEAVLPAETGLVERTVSFTKGCYVGQESVARLHHRGHANRRLARLAFPGPPPALPAVLLDGEREVGRVTSAFGPAGLGYVRREVADGADLAGRAADGSGFEARVTPLGATG